MRLIDADALSEKLCETTIFIKDGEVFQRMINDAPTVSAEAVQGWITDRNPTCESQALVTLDAFGHRFIDIFYYGKPHMPTRFVDGMCWYRSDDEYGDVVYDDKDIFAWMPLPKPYREDGKEE